MSEDIELVAIEEYKYDDLKKKEKVLEIIKKKKVNVCLIDGFDTYEKYNQYFRNVTKAEFNLIREWLENDK